MSRGPRRTWSISTCGKRSDGNDSGHDGKHRWEIVDDDLEGKSSRFQNSTRRSSSREQWSSWTRHHQRADWGAWKGDGYHDDWDGAEEDKYEYEDMQFMDRS